MATEEPVKIDRDLIYATVDGRDLRLDIYRPANATGPLPLIVWIHGGAWRKGSKQNPKAKSLVSEGYVVASVEYRLSQEAVFPAQIHDCKAAIRWLRKHATDYVIDPNRIGAWGPSAGGHLVALLGTSSDVADLEGTIGVTGVSSRVQAVCDWYGPTDFLRMNDVAGSIDHDAVDSPESQLIGVPIQNNAKKAARANPITYVSESNPPFLIMHGLKDLTVLRNQSEFLHAALQLAGVHSGFITVDDRGHGFRVVGDQKENYERHVLAFFDRVFKDRRSPWAEHASNPHPWVTDFGRNTQGSHDVIYHSDVIGGYHGYTAYLPPSYNEDTQRRYPVAYWLHGRIGRAHSANRFIARAHRSIESGLCPQMVIIAPVGLRSSMYVDSKDGVYPIESVIVNDLIPHVEATYRVKMGRKHRAIDGFSMGGFGAAHLGFKYPDLFGSISIMGAALHRPEFLRDQRPDIFEGTFGNDLAYCGQESPWTLVRQSADKIRDRAIVRLYVGSEDYKLRQKNTEYSALLKELKLEHEFGIVDGVGHNSAQVLDGIGDTAWTYYAKAFRA